MRVGPHPLRAPSPSISRGCRRYQSGWARRKGRQRHRPQRPRPSHREERHSKFVQFFFLAPPGEGKGRRGCGRRRWMRRAHSNTLSLDMSQRPVWQAVDSAGVGCRRGRGSAWTPTASTNRSRVLTKHDCTSSEALWSCVLKHYC
ncbi:hypothetical protein PVAP13_6NG172503 [Panicum virgatum]|uniref:Uncharacterized protein n=1 Tax=Panicum virgatum TaxID=38727 RepID=A0A8T0QWC6_PANVG|nr:hypothetical protein PVAP13_6NG172503 [Panicum virgatum]